MALIVDIEKTLGDFHLNVHFTAEREVMALLGASGCGKSMTLGCIAGIVRPDKGHIELNGRVLFDSEKKIDLPPQKRKVGYLFQQYALFPHMTVEQNIRAGAHARPKNEREQAVREVLHAFRLEGLENNRPSQLSGGQQQRCALARILVGQPELVLLDEPFSALDAYLKWQVELELSDILKNLSCGTLFVTHNRDEVYRLCDTVCVLNKGKSDPKETVKLFRAPATRVLMISGCSCLCCRGKMGEALFCGDWNVTLKTALHVPENIAYVGVRAHYFTTEGTENAIPCTVERVVENPFSTVVMLQTTGAGRLRWELDKAVWETLSGTEKLTLYVRPEDVMPLTE
ncbi:MAG: sulfate/molybdate ABC transporter ATP-binding protein [Butyricicoccus sp.]